jgi:CO/xanthine dehydrogenase Mo-binding subunit
MGEIREGARMSNERVVGTNVQRKEGPAKVLGAAKYVDDLTRPGMLHGATVRSTIARGKIKSIKFGEHVAWDEFTVVTAAEIPGKNFVTMFLEDQPLLAEGRINHPDEPILLLAHADRERLAAAVAAVEIEYEAEPGVFSIEDSLALKEVIWGSVDEGNANTFKRYHLERGEVDAAFAEADFIVEGEYRTGAQEQLYIEPNGMIAEATAEAVTVWGSMQCPFYVHRALKAMFALGDDVVRVVQTETGGAFGGKEDYPSILAGHCALLALKSGRPVKMIYDRAEDMAATTKRHPSRTRHRTAVSKEGKLLACEIEVVIDGGAYATLSSTVCSRATIHAAGPYQWPAVRVRSCAVATNTPPSGAFRGFGAPQSLFAIERHMEKIARVVGLTPEELRRRNFLATGGTTATGQLLRDPVDLGALLDRALAEAGYHAKKRAFAEANGEASNKVKRGIGFATFMHGAGFTGSGERYLNSLVGLEGTREGRVRVLVSSTEFGQGTNTILAQIAAEAMGADYAEIEVAQPDTGAVPNSGPTVASRTAMVVGRLVERTGHLLVDTLRTAGLLGERYSTHEFCAAVKGYVEEFGELKAYQRYEAPGTIFWDDQKYMGDAYPTYAWAVYVAEVAVDMTTYAPTVTEFHALQEVGRVIHPILAAGQIEGGVAQGIGYALYEKVVTQDGRMLNNQMTNYIMPTAADLPAIHVHFAEVPFAHGAFGAKGIGELPMDGPAPAILNAIEDATGIAFDEIPLMPEDVFQAVTHSSRGGSEDLDAVRPAEFTEVFA